jgi:hypothetical protein
LLSLILNRVCRRPLAAVLLAAPLTLGGCGIELAALGAAASAASQGSAVFQRGKLAVSWMGQLDTVVAATEAAGTDLGLLTRHSSGNVVEGQWRTVMYTHDGDKLVVTVQRKTPEFVQFTIDIGWFGSEPTARLLLKRMAVAIDLDATRDGSGTMLMLPPAEDNQESEPASDPDGELTPENDSDRPEPHPHNDPDDGEPPESSRGGNTF